jgi:hypothetical protein
VKRLAAALAVLALAGCGGAPVDDTRVVAPFRVLEVHDGVRVDLARGARPAVRVRGRKDVIDRVDTNSASGVLRVGVHDRGIVIGSDPMDDVRVRVTAPRLDDVRIDGSGDVDLGDVTARSLHLAINGTGDVSAEGTVSALTVVIHGAGDADFSALHARTARVEIRGAASVAVDVSRRLDVDIRGAGEVRYTGRPEVTREIQGAGDVRHVLP